MKTLTLQGTQKQFEKLYRSITLDDKDRNLIPQEVETRAYVLDTFNVNKEWAKLSDEEFITLVEEEGNIYTLNGFQEAFNNAEVNSEIDIVRFISVPLFL